MTIIELCSALQYSTVQCGVVEYSTGIVQEMNEWCWGGGTDEKTGEFDDKTDGMGWDGMDDGPFVTSKEHSSWSSSSVQIPWLTLGSRWWHQRSRHCMAQTYGIFKI